MEYEKLKDGIKSHLNAAAEDFFIVGYCLRQINENALFTKDGYKNIWEFAKAEYGLSTSSASRFMAINARFSIDGGEHMDQKYIGMGVSKLQEMLSLPDEELEKVTKETTVREIRALKAQAAKPLSFYGFPVTKRPEGSLLTTPGCGEGKHDCFSCCRDCAIRQEERYCVTAPMGKPFPCSHMSEDFRKSMEYSLDRFKCQMLHPELAPVRAGDQEPDPCCLTCEIKDCFHICDVAKKRNRQEQKERKAAERQEQQERKAAERQKQQEEKAARPDIIDADFREAADGLEKIPVAMTDKEKDALLKEKESDIIAAFYKSLYPGQKETIKGMMHGEITKMLKKEYGESYEGGRDENGLLWNCYPDKINLSISGLGRSLQITWGKFTTKLLALLVERPELTAEPAPEQEPEDLQEQEVLEQITREQGAREQAEEVEDEDELLCDECANASTLTGDVNACPNCGPEGRNFKPLEEAAGDGDSESYTIREVRDALEQQEKVLQEYRDAEMSAENIRRRRIFVDALTLLLKEMEMQEDDETEL